MARGTAVSKSIRSAITSQPVTGDIVDGPASKSRFDRSVSVRSVMGSQQQTHDAVHDLNKHTAS